MQRNWKKRLGSYQSSNPNKYNSDPKKKSFAHLKGAQQIKRHIFFKSIDWKLLFERKLKPPFIPKLNKDQTNNFDQEFTDMPIHSTDQTHSSHSRHKYNREKRKYLLKFKSFTYVRKTTQEMQNEMENECESENNEESDSEEGSESSYESGDDDSSNEEEEEDSEQSNDEEEDEGDGDGEDDGFEVFNWT